MLVEALLPGYHDHPLSFVYGRARITNPTLSDQWHGTMGKKPWTAVDTREGLRLTFLDDDLRDAVLPAYQGRIEIQACTSYARLCAEASVGDVCLVRLRTPTTIREHWEEGADGKRHKRSSLLPSPKAVFGSLLQAWGGPPLPAIDWEHVWVDRFDVRTLQTKATYPSHPSAAARAHPVWGLVGEMRFRYPGLPEEERRALNALAAFARFAGVGRRTTQGYGYVTMEVQGGCVESRHAGAQHTAVAPAVG